MSGGHIWPGRSVLLAYSSTRTAKKRLTTALVFRELFERVQAVLDAHSSGGERSWKHDHYLKGTLVCAECGAKLYYAVAKGRFGYFRCIGRNTRRTPCSQARYVPAAELERAVETLYDDVRIPAALRGRLERVLKTEVAERERHRAEATEFLGRRLRHLANEREKLLRAYPGFRSQWAHRAPAGGTSVRGHTAGAQIAAFTLLRADQATSYAYQLRNSGLLPRRNRRVDAEVRAGPDQRGGGRGRVTAHERRREATQAKQIIDLALDLAKDCATSYRKAKPEVRKMWNRAFFRTIRVRDGAIADFTYEEPFASLLGSHKGSMVDLTQRHWV